MGQHGHGKSSGNIESIRHIKGHHNSSSSIGKSIRLGIKHKVGQAISTAMYNSNHLTSGKQNEGLPSARNAGTRENHSIFVSGIANGVLNSGNQAPLREVQLNNDGSQKTNEIHAKIDRQNSFALYGNSKARGQSGSSTGGHNHVNSSSFGQKMSQATVVQATNNTMRQLF